MDLTSSLNFGNNWRFYQGDDGKVVDRLKVTVDQAAQNRAERAAADKRLAANLEYSSRHQAENSNLSMYTDPSPRTEAEASGLYA